MLKIFKYLFSFLFLVLAVAVLGVRALLPSAFDEPALPQMAIASPPTIQFDESTQKSAVEIDILTYNVAALPWPVKWNRDKALKMIGAELADLRSRGQEPDIVLIQEGFSEATKSLIEESGYPNWVGGPTADDEMPPFSDGAPAAFRQDSYFLKGERAGKLLGSGLYVLSNLPILGKSAQPFYRYECAGFDCAANKGLLGVGIEIPGMPGYLQIVTLHLNARTAAGVPEARSLVAHNLQLEHLDRRLKAGWRGEHPMILGGDFNMKASVDRFSYATSQTNWIKGVTLVDYYCFVSHKSCDVDTLPTSETPWLETQDWQLWTDGSRVKVKPIRLKTVFAEPVPSAPEIRGRRTLSDHAGVLVTYRLSWTSDASGPAR